MEKDELLCCEPCAVDVFSGTTRSTFVRAGCKMGESSRKPVNKQQYAYYGVDKRAICVTGLTINLPRDLRKEYWEWHRRGDDRLRETSGRFDWKRWFGYVKTERSWSLRETKQENHWYKEQRNLKFWQDQKEERWWWQRRRVNNVEGNVEWKCKGSLSLRIECELESKRVQPEKEGKLWKYIMMNYSTARATRGNWRVPSNVEHAGIFYHFVLL